MLPPWSNASGRSVVIGAACALAILGVTPVGAETPDILCATPRAVPPPAPPPPPPEPPPEEEEEQEPPPFLLFSAPFGERVVLRDATSSGPEGPHDYFESLKARDGILCAYGLRDQAVINGFSAWKGGANGVVTYSPATDDYHTPQDAARVEIRAVGGGLGSTSLNNQVLLPMPLAAHDDGKTYVVTWDVWMGPEFQTENYVKENGRREIQNYKWFYIRAFFDRSGGLSRDNFYKLGLSYRASALPRIASIWSEVSGVVGPDVLDKQPVRPNNQFALLAGTWTRLWFVFTQNPGEVDDRVSVWAADEHRDATVLIDNLTIEIPYDPFELQTGLKGLLIEFNSSQRRTQGGRMIAYVRNAALLRLDGALAPLLTRPVG